MNRGRAGTGQPPRAGIPPLIGDHGSLPGCTSGAAAGSGQHGRWWVRPREGLADEVLRGAEPQRRPATCAS